MPALVGSKLAQTSHFLEPSLKYTATARLAGLLTAGQSFPHQQVPNPGFADNRSLAPLQMPHISILIGCIHTV